MPVFVNASLYKDPRSLFAFSLPVDGAISNAPLVILNSSFSSGIIGLEFGAGDGIRTDTFELLVLDSEKGAFVTTGHDSNGHYVDLLDQSVWSVSLSGLKTAAAAGPVVATFEIESTSLESKSVRLFGNFPGGSVDVRALVLTVNLAVQNGVIDRLSYFVQTTLKRSSDKDADVVFDPGPWDGRWQTI